MGWILFVLPDSAVRVSHDFFGASLSLILLISFVPTWNALVSTSSGTAGVAVNSVNAMDCVPGSWLLNAARAEAALSPLFFWKWTRPLGNTNTSPFLTVLEIRVLAVVMKPTSRSPSRTNKISVARGWVCGGFTPPGAKSTRDIEMPKVLRPGIFSTLAVVTTDPTEPVIFPGFARPSKAKSEAVMFASLLHAKPLTSTPARNSKLRI